MRRGLAAALFLAACTSGGGEECNAFGTACGDGGTIESCCSKTMCHYRTSDGQDIPCDGTNCTDAASQVRAWCLMQH